MKSREQLNRETYQQAVKFAEQLTDNVKTEYLEEATARYQFEQQFDHNQVKQGQKNVAFSPLVVLCILTILIAISTVFYWQSGRYALVQKGERMHQAFQMQLASAEEEDKNERYLEHLQDRLRQNPNDGNLWYELGQVYALKNDFASALICYDNAQKVLGEKAAILGAMATADYYDKGQKLSPQAKIWIERALTLDKKESASLLILASDAFLNNDYQQAMVYWRKVLDSDNDAINRRAVIQSIEMARQMLGQK